MTQSKKIALCGGIGSGKSAALKIIGEEGYPAFSCDEIYREICKETAYLKAVEEAFPGGVKEGKLNREYLAKIVFSDEEKKRKLEALSHPLIAERLLNKMQKYPLSFAEVPLLFETGMEKCFDSVLVIARDRAARVRAVMARDGLDENSALLRLSSQRDWDVLPPDAAVIFNNGTLNELREKIREYLKHI